MLTINNLCKGFKKKEILHSINIELEDGVYGLLGENGAGKTTFMRCVAGLYNDYRGLIQWKCDNGMIDKNFRDKIGYLPQSFDGLGELRVVEFLKYFCAMKDIDKEDELKEIDRVLESVNLSDKRKEKVSSLSGGMMRRLGIAQTMLGNPNLIMYDEPTTGLDPKERIRFQNIIAENKKNKNITIISTHLVTDIEYLSDKIIVMKDGNVLGVYTPIELARKADGKIYELTEEVYEMIKNEVILIKISQNVSERKIRVMSDKPIQQGVLVDATVEDGYLWISK
ncbi:MAG: ATP-binding cassette domain-containing protein [Lachnospiraceae bacterium]|nr:ATP-binding cassette domain-containing protein [Lachnospiraceae bacterium]